jgi:hypothetical protein
LATSLPCQEEMSSCLTQLCNKPGKDTRAFRIWGVTSPPTFLSIFCFHNTPKARVLAPLHTTLTLSSLHFLIFKILFLYLLLLAKPQGKMECQGWGKRAIGREAHNQTR